MAFEGGGCREWGMQGVWDWDWWALGAGERAWEGERGTRGREGCFDAGDGFEVRRGEVARRKCTKARER